MDNNVPDRKEGMIRDPLNSLNNFNVGIGFSLGNQDINNQLPIFVIMTRIQIFRTKIILSIIKFLQTCRIFLILQMHLFRMSQ